MGDLNIGHGRFGAPSGPRRCANKTEDNKLTFEHYEAFYWIKWILHPAFNTLTPTIA
jgi:hypothetical protein